MKNEFKPLTFKEKKEVRKFIRKKEKELLLEKKLQEKLYGYVPWNKRRNVIEEVIETTETNN